MPEEIERPTINNVPALIDSFRMREKMGENGHGGSKRAIVKGTRDGIPYHEYEDTLARPERVRKQILDPYLDEPYMAAHVYLHSDFFSEDMKNTLLVPESIMEENEAEDGKFATNEKRLLDLTIECRNRSLESGDWHKLVRYVMSAGTIVANQYIASQYAALRCCVADGIDFERAALRWEALMMAGPTEENWSILVSEYPTLPIRTSRPDLKTIDFLGDAYILLVMASHHFHRFFLAEKERLGL